MTYVVTLVVPILNEAGSLRELLEAVKAQTHRPRELIFSDAGSTDGSPALIEKWWQEEGWEGADCRVLVFPGAMPGAGRNAGVRAASCEWIAFLDAGITPEPTWLANLCTHARTHNSSAVFGLCHFSADAPFDRAVCALSYGYGAIHPVIPASLFQRSVFDAIGFFPEQLRAAEDLVWVRRFVEHFGGREICPDALVRYTHFPTTWGQAIRKWRITEYHSVIAGARFKQQVLYVTVLPLLYYGLFSGTLLGGAAFALYMMLRGVIDPIRRSTDRPWWGRRPVAVFVALGLAAALDLAKFVGILQALFFKFFGQSGASKDNS